MKVNMNLQHSFRLDGGGSFQEYKKAVFEIGRNGDIDEYSSL